jgi:hypothetical protein
MNHQTNHRAGMRNGGGEGGGKGGGGDDWRELLWIVAGITGLAAALSTALYLLLRVLGTPPEE